MLSILSLLSILIVSVSADQGPVPPQFGPAVVTFGETAAAPASRPSCGFSLIAAREDGPQVAITAKPVTMLAVVRPNEVAQVEITIRQITGPFEISADVQPTAGDQAEVCLALGPDWKEHVVSVQGGTTLRLAGQAGPQGATLRLSTRTGNAEGAVRWSALRLTSGGRSFDVPLALPVRDLGLDPPPILPPMRPAVEQALIEWDWRMQDGIETEREPRTYAAAIEQTLERGTKLIERLQSLEVAMGDWPDRWLRLRQRWHDLSADAATDAATWESLWRGVHRARRAIALANPAVGANPLAVIKRVPSAFSHQLTQYYGSDARPGGGLFVLESPGVSMQCRPLTTGKLPMGSFQHPEVSFDGRHLLFAFCPVEKAPTDREMHGQHHYHLFQVAANGSGLKPLTSGPYDDFAPRYLPSGKIMFLSTRRRGFHRCGRGPCPVYTLTVANADGSDPHTISYHETHEWDPAIMHDGRVIYTRWDYVDRHAVHYQQLWSTRPDGTDVRIFYGNNTLNPIGVWEARPVPNSNQVMATAAAHHAMTAGSIILIDTTRGLDGLAPITRLTPDALFPESEVPVRREPEGHWHNPVGVRGTPDLPPAAARWPGHCYRTPYPLAEDFFLAAYSFDPLIGEPTSNAPNMFGIYLVDRFGNKELLYRDLNIGSLWPVPLAPRPVPMNIPSIQAKASQPEGTFFLQNVHASWPALPDVPITHLRIVQILPKSTPHYNNPPIGLAPASPGRQVLGTVPVAADGSAYFRAPAGIPLSFQALDSQGRAVQTMRSLTYLQPGETASCIGCHEPRTSAPRQHGSATSLQHPPSVIEPGPEGSKPFSYPRLVQPVLDTHCVRCHNDQRHDGHIVLTGEPQGHFTRSYNALAPWVPYSAWPRSDGDFRIVNSEPLTHPDTFGARASRLMELLLQGHQEVHLSANDLERLITWMDTNVLFYGTFNPEDQTRQQQGRLIAGPKIE